ncbi:MAG: response regulator [Candidatus Melainabacteria bacterium]|nr:response regulator [Candidatus Melainabacteria bacterium]
MEPGSSGEILIVDDDQAFRAFVSALLGRRGFKVWEARCVRDAEQILAASKPRLIIVDYLLPDMDGVTWIGKLRDSGNDTPIAFISGHWCDRSTFNWLRNILKVSLVLQKPVLPEIFVEVIDSILPQANYQAPETEYLDHSSGQFPGRPISRVSMIDVECENIRNEYPNSDLAKAELARLGNLESQPESVLFNKLNQLRKMLEVEETINVARASYIVELKTTWTNLTALLRSIKDDPLAARHVEDVLAITHRIKGTAGSFQLVTIAKCSERLENITKAYDPRASETESEIIWSEVFRILADGELALIDAEQKYGAPAPEAEQYRARFLVLADKSEASKLGAFQKMAELSFSSSHASVLTALSRGTFDAVLVAEPFASDPDLFSFCRDMRLAASNPAMPLLMVSDLQSHGPANKNLVPAKISYAGFSEVLSLEPSLDELNEAVIEVTDLSFKSKPKVLVVDDDSALTDFISRILSIEGFNVETLNEPIRIIDALDLCQPEVVVLDVIMPGLSGYDVCREIRNHERWRSLSVLFLTAKSNQEGRALAFRAGGDDLIAKPVLKEELIARVTSYAERTRLRRDQLDRDQLTHLLSREGFFAEAEPRMKECISIELPFTMALVNVDGFDKIDKNFGMAAAESVIFSLGALIRGRFEPSVIKARWAERVFALAFPDLSTDQAQELVELLDQEFSEVEFTTDDERSFRVSLTAGFASAPEQGIQFSQVRDLCVQNLIAAVQEKVTP